MNRRLHRVGSIALIALTSGCFRYRDLPPAETPAETIPAVGAAPAAEPDRAPVTFDLAVGHAVVEEDDATGTYSHSSVTISSRGVYVSEQVHETELSHAICTTPCVANMTPGPHTIRLRPLADLGADAVDDHVGFQVGARPLVVRAELKTDVAPSKLAPILLYMLATGLVVGGGVSLAFGSSEQPGWFVGGGVTIGVGVVSGVVGLIVDALTIGVRRKGSSTYWEPSGPSYLLRK